MKNISPTTPAARDPHSWIGTETLENRFGTFEFNQGYPSADTALSLHELQIFNRAVEVYLSQMPAVSAFHVRKALSDFGARGSSQFVIWESLMDAQTLLLTGNSETVYGMNFLNLRQDGPTVIEMPSMLMGGFSDMWQEQIMDVGPTGVDKGEGGKFLILPPNYDGTIPQGYFAAKSRSYGVWFAVNGLMVDGKPDRAVAIMKGIKIYPVGRNDATRTMSFLNASAQPINTIFPDNYQFFDSLAQLIEQEPEEAVGSPDRFSLAAIGIEKGKPFQPSARSVQLLAEGARFGSAIARKNAFASSDPARIVYQDRRWEWLFIGGSAGWDSQGFVNSDRRAAFAYSAIGMSPAMVSKVVGAGSQYFWTARDATGDYLDGAKAYRLNLPARIPAKNFWSLVAYDAESRSMLQNSQKFPSISPYTYPVTNPDGSLDIYFGPRAPDQQEKNWIQTVEGKGWFPILRFYGPLKPLFDQTWKPGDIEALTETKVLKRVDLSIYRQDGGQTANVMP